METHSGEDLLVLAYFGDEVVPDPVAVRRFVAGVRSAEPVPVPVPPEPGGDRSELVARLLRYRLDTFLRRCPDLALSRLTNCP